MAETCRLHSGDHVVVIAGGSKGKEGKINRIYQNPPRVVIEGVNLVKRHVRPSAINPQGGIVEQEAPIHISNVMLKDPESGKPVRIGKKYLEAKGKQKGRWVRVSKETGYQFDTLEGKVASAGSKDSKAKKKKKAAK